MIQSMARTLWFILTCGAALVAAALPSGATAAAPVLQFRTFVRTNVPLGAILWTGSAFIYDGEGKRDLYTSNPDGSNFRVFATVLQNGGEMRCILSPGKYGFAPNVIFCHASGGQIYQISMDGKTVTQLGAIPTPHGSDGGLAFDSTGMYGHVLLASTGGSDAGPGAVYTISASGKSHLLGSYAGPGGVEQLAIAPPHFGAVSGQVLLTIDKHDHQGRLLAMDAHGTIQTIVKGLTWGLDPITPLTSGQVPAANGVAPGLYMADWESHNVFYAPGTGLAQYVGSLFLATERHGFMYVLQAQGNGYHLQPLTTNLKAPNYNMEGVSYISG